MKRPALKHPRVTRPGPPRGAKPSTVARQHGHTTVPADLIDNLLSKGVMLNADLILALANVDLVYIRLSALLCAADRVLPPRGQR